MTSYRSPWLLILFTAVVLIGASTARYVIRRPADDGGVGRPSAAVPPVGARCGMCHLNPGPDALPRSAWAPFLDRKLALMRKHAATLGIDEGLLPTPAELAAIRSYILENAPSQDLLAPPPRVRLEPVSWLEPIASRATASDAAMGGYIGIWTDTATEMALLSDVVRGRLEVIDFRGRTIGHAPVGITPARIEPDGPGFLVPLMEDPQGGKVVRVRLDRSRPEESAVEVVLTGLERPIRAYSAVLAGREGILVEEFGIDKGGLRFWPRSPSGVVEDPMTVVNGSGVVASVLVDLDMDGTRDLVVLVSQESERLLVFRAAERALSEPIQLFQGHPGYGFNGLTSADVDGDGLIDLIAVNGDNYDLDSGPLKPYHGIRIFYNQGALRFSQPQFLPFHGAVDVLPGDFDLDGDTDLLALSSFPDYRVTPYESAVVFEQVEPGRFLPRAIEAAQGSRWVDAAALDLDGDGDQDFILIGAYSTLSEADRRWSDLAGPQPKTMLVLRNLTRR